MLKIVHSLRLLSGRPLLLLICLSLVACAADRPTAGQLAPDIFASMGKPLPSLSNEQLDRFERGRRVFSRRLEPSEGLGPEYSAVSCASCHEKPVPGGSGARYRNVFVRAGRTNTSRVQFERQFRTDTEALGRTPAEVETAARRSIPFFGIGLLAEIPLEEILSHADPNDDDGDGVSGRVNFERGFVGRFGRKAQMASLQGFVRLELVDHLNVTTEPASRTDFPEAPEIPLELGSRDADAVSDPELKVQDLNDLLAFVALMAAPQPDALDKNLQIGQRLFGACGCTSCHVPALRGPRGLIPAYTDLLLHDLGPELADGVSVGQATGSEFRTQPLWGIAATGPYLHDGRANSLDEAIASHGGEATSSRTRYLEMKNEEKESLLAFLRSLGRSDHRPNGLLPVDAPIPPVGELGGPRMELTAAERELFLRGRDLFDQDFAAPSGLGSLSNGDSCRSCHFDPVIGGAGPRDVDVIRQGVVALDGTVRPPSSGSPIAHRHATSQKRPRVSPEATFFERRQTPSILGLGLIDTIPEAAIRMREDPDDRDGDGIRGRARLHIKGRVGRFGWKADIASLTDFTIHALSNELGVTEAEIGSADIGALTFFMAQLAPPARRSVDTAAEARGEQVFGDLGCAKCHVPELPTASGKMARLYSDLLLHDTSPADAKLVNDTASGRAFRTPPLWGLSLSPPYLHDASAETIEEAITRHDGEAAQSRDAYRLSPAEQKADLLLFLRSL